MNDFPEDIKALGQAIQEAFDGSQERRKQVFELVAKLSMNPDYMTTDISWVTDLTLQWKFVYRGDNKPYTISVTEDQVTTRQINEVSLDEDDCNG